MKLKRLTKIVLASCATLAVTPLHAADNAQGGMVVSGEITPKLYSFDYTNGSESDNTQFLERYNYQKGIDNDNRSGSYFDADINIVGKDEKRNVFVLERKGFGAYNHRGTIKADSDNFGLGGYYTNYRSATGGLGFLYSPNVVDQKFGVGTGTDPLYNNTNTGYASQFNNDSLGQTKYSIDRTTYGVSLALKPELFNSNAVAALSYDGYQREGNRFATYVLGGSNINGGLAGTVQRWRGFDMPVEEKMNRYTLNLNGVVGGLALSYEGAYEKFNNQARDSTIADPASITPRVNTSINPLHFIPDTTLISNNIRLAKNFGSMALAAGYGLSLLDQDTFSQEQQSVGYNTGKILTNTAYLNVSSNALTWVGLEGFVKYYNRDNNSDFPVAGLLSATTDQTLDVRINDIDSLNYGLSATFRPSILKSTVAVGWKHEDKDRDLTWSTVRIPLVGIDGNAIMPQQSFYREQTTSDEVYVNLISRPLPRVILRVSPSYTWADDTGLVSEPERAFGIKNKLSYTASNGVQASGYYNYKKQENSNNSIRNNTAAAVPAGLTTTQDLEKTLQSAGVSLNVPFGEWINTSASLSWMQDDFDTYFMRQGRRRYEAPNNAITFIVQDRPNYNIDTYVFTLGGDWQPTDALRLNGSYSYTKSKGNTSSGYIDSKLHEIDGEINNSVHSLVFGVDYALNKTVKLKGSYDYEYYQDRSYDSLSGGYHALMIGTTFAF